MSAPKRSVRSRPFNFMRAATAVVFVLVLTASLVRGLRPPPREGTVSGIADGDTVRVYLEGRHQRVRMHGIDCPELDQPYGEDAKRFTLERMQGREVRLEIMDRDRHDRLVATVFYREGGPGTPERCLNAELVEAGWAWAYRAYSDAYVSAEAQARAEPRGLWKAKDPVPPWEHRKAAEP
ncbi:MAG: thermonuclease family protein [Planctomycetes bacterium]|nr:thermonuclease family protein [Planctomycetota bacterium]